MVATPTLDIEKSRSPKMTSGMSGSPVLMDCQYTNTAMVTTPTAMIPQIHSGQSNACPSCSAKTIRNMPTPDNTTPGRSKRCDTVGNAGTSHTASTKPMIPTGTLTMKIHCQPR